MTSQQTASLPAEPSTRDRTLRVFPQLLSLAWPIIVSRSTQAIIGLADALMVARLGESALAAATTGAFNTFALLILPMGSVFIVSSFSAQMLGSGDRAGARRYGFYGLGFALLAQALCLGGLPFVPAVLGQLDYADDVRRLMQEYLTWRLVAGGAAIGIEALANYYGGLGNTRLPMAVNVLAMVLNVGCNWLLIEGNLGFPAMGVKGAALASSIASTAGFVVILGIFLAEGRGLGRLIPRLELPEFVRMLRFGLPTGFNWFFEFFAFNFFVNVVMAGLGTTTLAAMMAVLQLNSISFMPAFGFASAGAILVGQAIGARRHDEVPRLVGVTFAASGGWQALVGIAYVAVPALVLAPFVQPGAAGEGFIAVGSRLLLLTAAWQIFDAAATTLAEALRAAGDTAFTLWARLLISWLIFVPGAWLSVRVYGWSETGAAAWVVLYLFLLAFALLVRFRLGAWRRISLVGEQALGH